MRDARRVMQRTAAHCRGAARGHCARGPPHACVAQGHPPRARGPGHSRVGRAGAASRLHALAPSVRALRGVGPSGARRGPRPPPSVGERAQVPDHTQVLPEEEDTAHAEAGPCQQERREEKTRKTPDTAAAPATHAQVAPTKADGRQGPVAQAINTHQSVLLAIE